MPASASWARVLAYMRGAAREAMGEQIAFAEIPCPDWRARGRGDHLAARLAAEGLEPFRDKVGNVIAVRGGAGGCKRPPLVVCAHMDSVFPEVKEINVRRSGKKYHAPGVCDNAVGVANLVLLARALARFKIRTGGDLVLVGSVGEEGEGRLRGMRHFFTENRFRGPWFIAADGPGTCITRKALASWSPRIKVAGPGGHSYGNFGRPNPIHMLSRFVSKITNGLEADPANNTVFNATVISGGTAVNVIPQQAGVTVNLRSSHPGQLAAMVKRTRRFLREARAEELKWATAEKWLKVNYTALTRPGGETPEDHDIVRAARRAFEAERLKPRFTVGSTDANMPMSLGLPAICIGGGGRAANAHSLDEWYDNRGRGRALAALARMVFELTR